MRLIDYKVSLDSNFKGNYTQYTTTTYNMFYDPLFMAIQLNICRLYMVAEMSPNKNSLDINLSREINDEMNI